MPGSQSAYTSFDNLYSSNSQLEYSSEWSGGWQLQLHAGPSHIQERGPMITPSFNSRQSGLAVQTTPSFQLNPQHDAAPLTSSFALPVSDFDGTSFFNFDFSPTQSVPPNSNLLQPAIASSHNSLSPLHIEQPLATSTPIPRSSHPIDPRFAIDRLPREVHDRICDLLEPKDIVKWSRVRRSTWIYSMRLRSTWLKVMKKMCYTNAIPVNFLLYGSNILATSLYWEATMPDRILHWIRAQPVGAFNHTRRRFDCQPPGPDLSLKPVPSSKHSGLATYLVPGGRYLITDDGRQMSVFDLGVGSHSEFKWVSTISHEHPRRTRVTKPTIEAYGAPDAMVLRVVVFFDHTREKMGRFYIYHVHLGDSDDGSIQLLGTGIENHKSALYTFKEDVLATLAGNNLFLWNFVKKVSINMTIQNDPPGKLMMFSKSGDIVVVHLQGVASWTVPRFLFTAFRGQSTHSIPNRVIPPKYFLPTNFNEVMQSDAVQRGYYTHPTFEKPPMWYEDFGSHEIVFDVVRNRTGRRPCQFRTRYQLGIPGPDDMVNLPSIECISRFNVPYDWTTMRMIGYCNDQILLAGMCEDGFAGVASAPGISRRDRPPLDPGCHSGLLFQKRRQMFSDDFVFCPVTSRVCYETTPYMITILDYFSL